MCFQLRDALKVGNICFLKHFFSVKHEPDQAIRDLANELTRFAIITEPAKTLFGRVSAYYHTHADTVRPSSLTTDCWLTGPQDVHRQDRRAERRPRHRRTAGHHWPPLFLRESQVRQLRRAQGLRELGRLGRTRARRRSTPSRRACACRSPAQRPSCSRRRRAPSRCGCAAPPRRRRRSPRRS